MEEALSFFRAFEVWIYLLLGLGGLLYLRKFIMAWQELRGAGFGLERESAQSRLNQSASMLVMLLSLAIAEFMLVSFVAPAVPGANPLLTPTINLLASPTPTIPAMTPVSGEVIATPVPAGGASGAEETPGTAVIVIEPTLTPAPVAGPGQNGCQPGQVEITSPETGQEVSGVVEVMGSADIPNFGFYMFEMKRPEETVWLTLQAGNIVVKNGKLGDWDTRRLTPGEYQLALVVVDNQAQTSAPCSVQVRVSRPPEETPNP